MIPIISFSWQAFKPVELPHARVSDLYLAAEGRPPYQPFVFHDPAERTSALVFPQTVFNTVHQLDLPRYQRLSEIGLIDLLRQNQLTVQQDLRANTAIALAELRDIDTIIVTDASGRPSGLVVLPHVRDRLPNAALVLSAQEPLVSNVRESLEVGNLADAIYHVERALPEFHSESLNLYAPEAYLCPSNGGHFGDPCPGGVCSQHGTPCEKVSVAAA